MSSVIKVENLSKKFIIGHEEKEKYTALRDVMVQKAKKIFSFPFSKSAAKTSYTTEEFWALRNVNFEIAQGDRVGIIGRNGAGKSTLLKVLSRITEPSAGTVRIKGRVASLLEVGTGFHPELSGRENIFLNGAILGMSRAEIRNKFDEIVAFAEVEKFLDTPVKRYSSGMYVRLAFAVAAHLEPEILIVDEVLAVGDAQFQKKCLGKMEDVSKNQGRTVLFVSHNMGVISQLCKSAILLKAGSVEIAASVAETIEKYVLQNNADSLVYRANSKSQLLNIFVSSVEITNINGRVADAFLVDENIVIKLRIGVNHYNPSAKISVTLQNMIGDYLSTFVENVSDYYTGNSEKEFELKIKLAPNLIAPNSYAFRISVFVPHGTVYDLVEMVCPIRIIDSGSKMAMFEGFNYGNFIMDYQIIP